MDESVIKRTQDLLGSHVKNPPLAEKFLQKPPLRFLHDVFLAVVKTTGVMGGLFDNDETSWTETVANDKDAKAFFLAKVINYVCIASNQELDTKPARICAGQEAEKTNELLQSLGTILSSKSIDNASIVQQIKMNRGPLDLSSFSKGAAFVTAPVSAVEKPETSPSKPGDEKPGTKNQVLPKPVPPKQSKLPVARKTGAPVEKPPAKDVIPESKSATAKTVKVIQTDDHKKASAKDSGKHPDPARKDASAKSAPNVTTKKENESTHATKDRKGPKMPPQSTAPHAVKPILVGSGTQPGSQDDVVLGAQNVPLVPLRPTTARPVTARPGTARRAPQRPPTATIKSRKSSLVAQLSADDGDIPPANIKFLTDSPEERMDDLLAPDVADIDETGRTRLDLYTHSSFAQHATAGQLVAHLQSAQKTFAVDNEVAAEVGVSPFALQEAERFSKDAGVICEMLQRVSRFTDILNTCMDMLPEDLEEMDRDQERYRAEYLAIQQQIDLASKVEREHVEKLHRELAFQEELVFAVGEVIASAQYRIKDKSELRDRLIRLQSIEKS